ncbi:MAG: Type 1 glutamine amidotransferase-like domain-containing protein [Acidobacteria bacterium]|nr:Type 1 glutamine amidotransferase-like domain-containing protein [Acidobacteriota bacterium]
MTQQVLIRSARRLGRCARSPAAGRPGELSRSPTRHGAGGCLKTCHQQPLLNQGDIQKDIDREIIRLSNKQHPKMLFIPTASSDSGRYCTRFAEYFGKFLKCKTDVLFLIDAPPSAQDIERKIFLADIVYVGGGNTLNMMRVWRRLGVDKLLRAAYEHGIVLAGISAGAICWFDSGHSDSMSFYDPRNWKYINVKGLGLINAVHCPHYNSMTRGVPRRRAFREMIHKIGGTGIALENNCAMEFIDNRLYRVISSKSYSRAYRVYRSGADVVAEQIRREEQWAPVESLTYPKGLSRWHLIFAAATDHPHTLPHGREVAVPCFWRARVEVTRARARDARVSAS